MHERQGFACGALGGFGRIASNRQGQHDIGKHAAVDKQEGLGRAVADVAANEGQGSALQSRGVSAREPNRAAVGCARDGGYFEKGGFSRGRGSFDDDEFAIRDPQGRGVKNRAAVALAANTVDHKREAATSILCGHP